MSLKLSWLNHLANPDLRLVVRHHQNVNPIAHCHATGHRILKVLGG
jgi:hypothetical protein